MSQPDDQKDQSQQPGGDLASELRELGQQIEAAVRSAVQSDKAKQIQQDVASGMKEIGVQLQSAFKAMQDNPRFQDLVTRGEQAVSQAQQSKAAQDFQETLARGVAQLNEQLAAFATRMRQQDSADAADATPDASTPPATGSGPATGETTRLDADQQ